MSNEIIGHAADIVADYVANNKISPEQVQTLIHDVYQALSALGTSDPIEAQADSAGALKPTAAQIRKSITPDAIVSFYRWQALQDAQKAPDDPRLYARDLSLDLWVAQGLSDHRLKL